MTGQHRQGRVNWYLFTLSPAMVFWGWVLCIEVGALIYARQTDAPRFMVQLSMLLIGIAVAGLAMCIAYKIRDIRQNTTVQD